MIKWRGEVSGKETIGLGLSAANVAKLRHGYPIVVKGTELGIDFDILIHYGLNEDAIAQELKGLMTPDAIIHVTPRGDDGQET